MIRLTTRTDTPRVLTKSGRDAVLALQMMGYDSTAMEIDDILKRLAEYEDTGLYPEDVARMVQGLKTGKLQEMPACIGDVVWEIRCNYVHEWNGKRYDNSLTGHTALFKNHPNDLYPAQKICTKSDLKFMGKTVFQTEAEAVAAIEEAVRNV